MESIWARHLKEPQLPQNIIILSSLSDSTCSDWQAMTSSWLMQQFQDSSVQVGLSSGSLSYRILLDKNSAIWTLLREATGALTTSCVNQVGDIMKRENEFHPSFLRC